MGRELQRGYAVVEKESDTLYALLCKSSMGDFNGNANEKSDDQARLSGDGCN